MSMGERIGLLSFLIAVLLLFFAVELAVIPLVGFILLCIAAPFFPRFSFFLPIISRGTSGKKAVALTFDDGPDPLSTPVLLRLLLKHQIKATFFVTGKNTAEHPELIKEILHYGHSIGNHSYTHNNLLMFRSSKFIAREIESAQNVLNNFGVIPLAFRPPVGITGPRLRPALLKTGMYTVNFSCRGPDAGNRWIKGLSKKILRRIRPEDIIALHDVRPHNPLLFASWIDEIELILSGIKDKGIEVLPLGEIIGRPVMKTEIDGMKPNLDF
ncbi:MAG TPA: polysaccharide deacetylase family protein [Desulfobacteraceae bacterium]|nr:polysaccharide deacetylase family protein [Desulfobacteraceae bacterium]